jgi:hypothetical protein
MFREENTGYRVIDLQSILTKLHKVNTVNTSSCSSRSVTVKTDSSAAPLVVMATFVLVNGVVGVVICD